METCQELFCIRGIPETTMMDIAAAAGTTRATVYKHFDAKELILNSFVYFTEKLKKYTDM